MRWFPLLSTAAITLAVVAACSSSDDKDAKKTEAKPDAATFMPDRPVNQIVDGGSCPDPYPGPGPEILTRTPPVDQAVEAIYAIRPDLEYIAKLKREYPGGDGPHILPFAVEGGFDIAMINATGDCEAGCTMFEYWYFEVRGAEPTWTATDVGHYLPPEPATACDKSVGTPMWNTPVARPCDDGGAPAPVISGTRAFCATGALGQCDGESKTTLPAVTVDFAPGDAGTGTVTVHGTGAPAFDERTYPATYTKNHVAVATNFAGSCGPVVITMDFDFAAGSNAAIAVDEVVGCTPDGGGCKTRSHFTLSAP